ncbi:hypothetical protein F5B20DRAFT_575497 [Whalleya microplaca]|nr:hypothetical protein F5B20DRAFT_575497 [Whalleya microplaca]
MSNNGQLIDTQTCTCPAAPRLVSRAKRERKRLCPFCTQQGKHINEMVRKGSPDLVAKLIETPKKDAAMKETPLKHGLHHCVWAKNDWSTPERKYTELDSVHVTEKDWADLASVHVTVKDWADLEPIYPVEPVEIPYKETPEYAKWLDEWLEVTSAISLEVNNEMAQPSLEHQSKAKPAEPKASQSPSKNNVRRSRWASRKPAAPETKPNPDQQIAKSGNRSPTKQKGGNQGNGKKGKGKQWRGKQWRGKQWRGKQDKRTSSPTKQDPAKKSPTQQSPTKQDPKPQRGTEKFDKAHLSVEERELANDIVRLNLPFGLRKSRFAK